MAKPRTVAPGIGARIESLVPKDRTLAEFAAALGVSDRTVGNYIRGDNEPSASFLEALHRQFGVDVNWLLTGEEACCEPRVSTAHRIEPVVMARVSSIVAAAHKKARIRITPEALVREATAIYNDMVERVDNSSDVDELQALLPWAEARLTKRLAEAAAKPGTGKRSA